MFKYCLLALLVTFVTADLVKFHDCGKSEVTKLNITGCAVDGCIFKKGGPNTLTMEFVANQDSAKVEVRVVAKINNLDIPVPGIDADGCKYIKCPLVKGQKYSFVRSEPVSTFLPSTKTEISVKLTGDHDGVLACFSFNAEYV